MQKSLGIDVIEKSVGNPISLLYLGIDQLYGLYNINGELIGINLEYGDAVKLSAMKSGLTSPVEYKNNQSEANSALASEALTVSSMYTSNFLIMGYYSEQPNQIWCGPCSAVIIAQQVEVILIFQATKTCMMYFITKCQQLPGYYRLCMAQDGFTPLRPMVIIILEHIGIHRLVLLTTLITLYRTSIWVGLMHFVVIPNPPIGVLLKVMITPPEQTL